MPTTLRTTAPTTRTAVQPIAGPSDAYVRSLRLGFTYPQIAGGDGTRLAIGPSEVNPQQVAEVAAVREYIVQYEVQVLAIADGKPGLARPPEPRRKVGHYPDGRPMGDVVLDLPEPPPPPHTPTLCDDIGALRTVGECDAFIERVELGLKVAHTSLGYLPEVVEDEPVEIARRRERLHAQLRLLGDHLYHLQDRRRELFMTHIDRCAAARQLAADGGPRVPMPASWHSGRMI